MNEQLIEFPTAKLAKKKGFDIKTALKYWQGQIIDGTETPALYNLKGDCQAPTQSLLQKWLREEYGIHIYPSLWISMDRLYCHSYNIFREMSFDTNDDLTIPYSDFKDGRWRVNTDLKVKSNSFPSYEEALEKGLHEALTLIKTK